MREKFRRTVVEYTIVNFIQFNKGNPEIVHVNTFEGYARNSDIEKYQKEHPELKLEGTQYVRSEEKKAVYEYTADIVRKYGKKV